MCASCVRVCVCAEASIASRGGGGFVSSRGGGLGAAEVEAVQVHHLGPRPREVRRQLAAPAARRVHLRHRAQLRVAAQHQGRMK